MSPSSSDPLDQIPSIYGSRKASLTLDVIVVGGGIGGLSAAFCLTQAGHHVTIVESSPEIGPAVGTGILSTPNCSRLLRRWGLEKRLDELSVRGKGAIIRKYNTGEQIGFSKWGDMMKDYGAPHHQVHRSDLYKMLYDLVAPNVNILSGSPVVGCDPGPMAPSVTLESGKVLNADLIVGADGLKSYIQQVVSGEPNRAEATGHAAYRTLVPTSLMVQDPELRELVEDPHLTVWMAPEGNLVGYSVMKGEMYNLTLSHPDEGGSKESWSDKGNVEEMRHVFADYEPRVQKILALVQSNLRLRLMDRKPLAKWHHDSGRVTLLGDACHPMLPYRAQGAAMAIEDAAVLGNLLSRISQTSQLGPLLKAYQDLRLDRTALTQASSRSNLRPYQPPDGEEQRRRDENMKREALSGATRNKAEERIQPSANQKPASNGIGNEELFGYDADAEVEKWWASHGKELEALVGSKPPMNFTGSDAAFACVVSACVCFFTFLKR